MPSKEKFWWTAARTGIGLAVLPCLSIAIILIMQPRVEHNYSEVTLKIINQGRQPVNVRTQLYNSRRILAEGPEVAVPPGKKGVEINYPRIYARDHTLSIRGTLVGRNSLLFFEEITEPAGQVTKVVYVKVKTKTEF